ncbi:MAG: hypothetical protein GTO41_24330, partial [Burkholderiales bacterium]|nr:hypothetical protein [Burkholderiales bacterium]
AQLRQEKNEEAIASFTALEANQDTNDVSQQLRLIATCLRAQALGAAGNPDEGIRLVTEIIQREDSENRPLFAHAYNALGNCHLKAGNKKAAMMAFLHTETMYFMEPEPHAESLFHLYHIWTDLKKTDRANDARQKVKDRYRNTHWA